MKSRGEEDPRLCSQPRCRPGMSSWLRKGPALRTFAPACLPDPCPPPRCCPTPPHRTAGQEGPDDCVHRAAGHALAAGGAPGASFALRAPAPATPPRRSAAALACGRGDIAHLVASRCADFNTTLSSHPPTHSFNPPWQAGEVIEYLVDEGQPVEYKQPVVLISPYFGARSASPQSWVLLAAAAAVPAPGAAACCACGLAGGSWRGGAAAVGAPISPSQPGCVRRAGGVF